ncbi:hypothetical protein J2W83_000812 [Pseudomonas hunanensis]|uniref:Uncharacterized protein n=1 Tax=Pseudomonas hunanensis TaxID=1247546 RepID=A0ACC6JYD3_9PSED|nr:hypothetical protein [Pseudomonas hunanensis]
MSAARATPVQRPIDRPIRSPLSWQETWEGPDNGLIRCREIGRERARANTELAQRCRDGQLPVLDGGRFAYCPHQ